MVHIFFVVLAAKNDLDSLAQSKYEFCHLLFWPGILQTSRMENLQLCSSPSQMFAGIQVTLLVAATDFRREVQQNVSKIMLTQCSQSFRFVIPFFSVILIFHHLFHRHTTIVRVLQQKIHMQRMDGAHQIAACFRYLPSPHSHLSFALL